MNILLLEPFFSGSHKRWATELQKFSRHNITLLTLPGRYWKWRMYGGAVALAAEFDKLTEVPDLILATDMLDLTTFLTLTRKRTAHIPTALYFHENQITYPWSPTDADVKKGRNNQYGFLNYTSALAADAVFFNSYYHKNSFTGALPGFLRQFPDCRNPENVQRINDKSQVLPLGLDLKKYAEVADAKHGGAPVLLWNHRWEYDKNPDDFFAALFKLQEEEVDFQLIVTGENYKSAPPIFAEAQAKLQDKVLHFGYADSAAAYAALLHRADILPVTSRQDFFGGSVVEAIYCNCFPLLPDRLAYPEHIPAHLHGSHIYKGAPNFYERLKETIENFTAGRISADYRHFAARYDWAECVQSYDTAFAALV